MLIIGLEFITSQLSQEYFTAKLVFNAAGAIFFPVHQEHRDQKLEGISYEDDYRGNAMAAMLAPRRIEVRYHAGFTAQQVARILAELAQQDGLGFIRDCELTYRGEVLKLID